MPRPDNLMNRFGLEVLAMMLTLPHPMCLRMISAAWLAASGPCRVISSCNSTLALIIKLLQPLLPVGEARLGLSLWHDGVLGPGAVQIAGLLLKQPMLGQLTT